MPNSEDDFAQLGAAIFSKSLKIELNHNLEKGSNMQKWMGTWNEIAKFVRCICPMNSEIFSLKSENVTEAQLLKLR